MTTTATCARDLWTLGEPTFCALIRMWAEERRCPRPLVDLLLEYGLDDAAEAATWASTEGPRPGFSIFSDRLDFPMPSTTPLSQRYRWYCDTTSEVCFDNVPTGKCQPDKGVRSMAADTLTDALILLLDRWNKK